MNNVQQVFEQAFRELNPGNHFPLLKKYAAGPQAGEYLIPQIRQQYAFFVLGLECGKVVARPGFKLVEVPVEPGDLEG